ncbi:MAG: ATP-binding cassette domain-containing protein [Corynebacterium sp.]|nr:ATP-binding cassette domain-containing protein [Corynebacterium sp.]
MMGALLEIKDFKGAYQPDQNPIVAGSNLTLRRGVISGLIGGNGAGKTTLIRGISGILEHFEFASAFYDGAPIDLESREFKSQRITVFTEDRSFPHWSFREYMAFVLRSYRLTAAEDRLDSLIKGFNFHDHLNTPLGNLSSGNAKKARLIAAFMLPVPLIILDEPVDALDFLGTEFLYSCIFQAKSEQRAVLMSSHIAESLTKLSDELYVLQHGVLTGPEVVPQTAEGLRQLLDTSTPSERP